MALLAALLLAAPVFGLVRPTAAETSASLVGQLLIASPSMGDPRFARTVILMVRHSEDGAFGIVINRPIAERPVAELLAMLGENDAQVSGKVRIHYGGPVQPKLGFVLHTSDYRQTGTLPIGDRMAMTSSREIIREIGSNAGPKKSLFAFGYAGWAPGQLEGELKRGSWATAPADVPLVFDEDRDKVWDEAYGRRMQDL